MQIYTEGDSYHRRERSEFKPDKLFHVHYYGNAVHTAGQSPSNSLAQNAFLLPKMAKK
jgi:hypothetical protein